MQGAAGRLGRLPHAPHELGAHARALAPSLGSPPTLPSLTQCPRRSQPTRVRAVAVPIRARSQVRIVEHSSSFLSFLTSACAIVGGVFTVSGIVDGLLFAGTRLVRKKMELGKFS
jgi:hypothetical protein